MCHRHQILTRLLPRIDPTLQSMQGYLIATHIKEVAVEMQKELEDKAHVREWPKSKGVPNILGINLAYLLRLYQVVEHVLLLPVLKSLVDASKRQQLKTLQSAFENTTQQRASVQLSLKPQFSSI